MYAEVVLAKATPYLDKIFHYQIRDELKDQITIGSQVLIPFGKGERIGYVVGFVETSDVPNIKPITSLISNTPSFTANGLRLARFISEYYLSFFSTALRAILPPGVKNKTVKVRAKKS